MLYPYPQLPPAPPPRPPRPPQPPWSLGGLLDGQGVSIDGGGAFLDQLFGGLLSLKGDKGKVLWFIVLALVHRPHNLCNRAKCNKVSLNLLIGDALGGEVAEVDLALLGLGLLAGDLLPLDHVGLLAGGGINACAVLEQDEGKSSGSSCVGICLQVDILNLSKLSKIFLDICVLGFLWKTSNKELSVIFMDWIRFSCHFWMFLDCLLLKK